MEWDTLFNALSSFLLNISRREDSSTSNVAESILVSIQSYIRVLCAIKTTLSDINGGDSDLLEVLSTVSDLLNDLEVIYCRWTLIESGVQSHNNHYYAAVRIRTGVGRPKVKIEKEKIEFLQELKFTLTEIAMMFGVCRRTLFNIRHEYGMLETNQTFTSISDHELLHEIRAIKQDMPDVGYNMLKGVLRARGIHVSIPRIQQSLHEVDPINTALRWAAPVSRRVYGVPYPNYIWHLDGNHKLVRWGIVVHGGIDGYSRLIVFLQCSSNNQSDTVLKHFLKGAQLYGLPERIRTDRGGENVQVAEYMLTHSVADNPVLVGSSVHNSRIERLWRDTFRCVLSVFYQLFYHLEGCGKLDPLSVLDLFCVHFVFLPRITNALDMFEAGWNNHAITTEKCKTPIQLFTRGTIAHGPQPSQHSTIDNSANNCLVDVSSGVLVPEINCPLNNEKEAQLKNLINPLKPSSSYGIDIYDQVKLFVLNNV